jgi:hypothetical protein
LVYDGTDSVLWAAKVRMLVTKLKAKEASFTVRTVRNFVLKALEQESEYKIRVEVIRHSQPDINLVELWAVVARLPYPLKLIESAFSALDLTFDGRSMYGAS